MGRIQPVLTGYDIDGVLTAGFTPSGHDVVISGRTFAEYDETAKAAAQICPVYIRGVGTYGDRSHAGTFKAAMINTLGVTRFYEDDRFQADIITKLVPHCQVVVVQEQES
jgi:hypothetical protein